jgi:transcriptional regulator with XRE-family HTH domain
MGKEYEGPLGPEPATQRLNDFLELLSVQGYTQTQIAAKAGLTPQYLSDIKRGHRPVTELVARRLGEPFDVSFQWFRRGKFYDQETKFSAGRQSCHHSTPSRRRRAGVRSLRRTEYQANSILRLAKTVF